MKKFIGLAGMLAWQDMRQAYRRSAIGPFWLTIGMAVQIVTMGLVFGVIFKSDMSEYLPFLAASTIIWGYISNSINDGCMTFISSEAIIKQLNVPHFVFVIRTLWRNFLIFGHNIIILPFVFGFFLKFPSWEIVTVIPGLLLLSVNLAWLLWLLGILSARYRDMPPIISSFVTIAFYLTPVIWYPKLIESDSLAHLLLGLNPFYHWLQVVRLPILGEWPTPENWFLASLSAVIGWSITLLVFRSNRQKIAYWV